MTASEEVVPRSLALKPVDIDAVPGLVKEINDGVATLAAGDTAARHKLIWKVQDLLQSLRTPREIMARQCWGEIPVHTAVIFGNDIGLWTLMAKNGDGPQKISELAETLKVDPKLLGRLMRHFSAMGHIKETGEDEYMPNAFTKSLSLPILAGSYPSLLTCCAPAYYRFHEFAKKNGYQNPSDAKNTSLMNACDTKLDAFSYMQACGYGKEMNNLMAGYRQGRIPWMAPEFYPVKERLIAGADTSPDAAFLVDVGGNEGHDLVEFHQYHPDAPGKLICQDLPAVIDHLDNVPKAITPMAHDFMNEQPVKGARAYYTHSVLHDWPNDDCLRILGRIKDAMKPGYSKLLVNENVIPKRSAYWEHTGLDITMLTTCSAQERTESDWVDLLEKGAGFKILKFWKAGPEVEPLIECEIPTGETNGVANGTTNGHA